MTTKTIQATILHPMTHEPMPVTIDKNNSVFWTLRFPTGPDARLPATSVRKLIAVAKAKIARQGVN
jgi:hypothetical protein